MQVGTIGTRRENNGREKYLQRRVSTISLIKLL